MSVHTQQFWECQIRCMEENVLDISIRIGFGLMSRGENTPMLAPE
jgi:hypothetical protein